MRLRTGLYVAASAHCECGVMIAIDHPFCRSNGMMLPFRSLRIDRVCH